MTDINDYCERLKQALLSGFGDRLCYMGLQGSFLRGEAGEHSDIDIMAVLETLTVEDLECYRGIIERVGDFDRSCGFICSREDLACWNRLELCQLLHTTRDIYGRLSDLLPEWTREDEINYVKFSLNSLYHALCHTYIHRERERLAKALPGMYKSAFFILQNTHFLKTGSFILPKSELAEVLDGEDREVLETAISISEGIPGDAGERFSLLLGWCGRAMRG